MGTGPTRQQSWYRTTNLRERSAIAAETAICYERTFIDFLDLCDDLVLLERNLVLPRSACAHVRQ